MASVRKRNGKWQVQVRRQGRKSISQSFNLKEDALVWARTMEIAMDRKDIPGIQSDIKNKTLADLLEKYLKEVTPTKRGWRNDGFSLRAFIKHDIASKRLIDITPHDFAIFRDRRTNFSCSALPFPSNRSRHRTSG